MSGHTPVPPDAIDLPLLPLRDVVVFPHMVIPLFVGRPKSIKALDVLKEGAHAAANDVERFDNDFVLMTGELAKMLADLVEALGGEARA